MKSYRIVKRLNVLEHTQPSFLQISKRLVIGPLVFQRPEESFHGRVVVTATGAAHRALDAEDPERLLV